MSKPPRIFRYEVDEVWGDDPPVEVGAVIVDRWKGDRTWQLYHLPTMTPTSGWHAKLLGEASAEIADQARANWASDAWDAREA